DADLVFADAGRRAARRAVKRMYGVTRLFGRSAARRAARAVLGAELGFEHRFPVARVSDPIAIQATPDGTACGFYGAGLVELRRLRMARRRPRSAPPMTPLEGFDFAALRELLGSLPADAWLLYDFRGINPAATRVLGIHGMGTRRFFVLLPRDGQPVALAHRIELAAFDGFPGEVRPYAAWTELNDNLPRLV